MDEGSAREYSEAMGQIGAGWWRQVAWAERQGIPSALGLNTREWVEHYLGGHMRMALDTRREAVKELDDGTRTGRDIAEILGVDPATISRDRREPEIANATAATPEHAREPEPEIANARAQTQVFEALMAGGASAEDIANLREIGNIKKAA